MSKGHVILKVIPTDYLSSYVLAFSEDVVATTLSSISGSAYDLVFTTLNLSMPS